MGSGLETLTGFLSLGHCLGVPLVSQHIFETWFQVVRSVLICLSWDLMPSLFQCLRQGSCLAENFLLLPYRR